VFNKPISRLTRAEIDLVPSKEKSLIFAWPLTLKADGVSKSEINVVIRNNNLKFIEEKQVTVKSTLGDIKSISNTTDKGGKTSFELTSTTPGIAEVSAYVDNTEVGKKITVKFE
jgi:hypothetical protein